jgi:hypothetical protein
MIMSNNIEGKVVVITGASSGMGEAAARRDGAQGVSVALGARRIERHEGRIRAGGVEKDVTFVEESNPPINDQIDAAYRSKYRRYPQYVAPILTPKAQAATIKLVPHLTNS